MRLHDTPGVAPGQPNLAVEHQESPGLSLTGLRDLLDALTPQIRRLPAPLPLFALELEEGLAEQLGFEGENRKATDDKLDGRDVGGSAEHIPDEGVDSCC